MPKTRRQRESSEADEYRNSFGVQEGSYQDYVENKRKRNLAWLKQTGLLEATATIRESISASQSPRPSPATSSGIKRKKVQKVLPRRKSDRLAGVKADDVYVEEERNGKVSVRGGSDSVDEEGETFYGGRVNDGSDLSISEAVELTGSKWISDDSVENAETFLRETLQPTLSRSSDESSRSCTSSSLLSQIPKLKANDPDSSVTKVTPDRILSIAAHPSPHTLLPAAGDKQGYVGLWNVNASPDAVYLFKPHNLPVTHLEWNASGSSLFSTSYDGTVRELDVETQTFKQVFATYDDSPAYRRKLGYGLDIDKGRVQYSCMDNKNENCMFLTTTDGRVIHVDLRSEVTLNEKLSNEKINSLSQHRNQHTIAVAGRDRTIQLFDTRKDVLSPFAVQHSSNSINSAFFSSSGSYLLATTYAPFLDLTHDAHLQKGTILPNKKIKHDNNTGRWLSTFMANWHPFEDLFVVGSMEHPRRIEIFDHRGKLVRAVKGEAITSVSSRCCFLRSEEKLVVFGGNSSGRVVVLK